MPLTKEQLLIPRWKVIGKIPFLSKGDAELYPIGSVITDDGIRPATNSNGDPVFITEWEEYPHIFQPLPWWSDRKVEEMPKYLRWRSKQQVIRPVRWETNYEFFYLSEHDIVGYYTDYTDPATEEEYNAYINQKQQ